MMRKTGIALLLLSFLVAATQPLQAQTRSRRVQAVAASSSALREATGSPTTTATTRPRVSGDRQRTTDRETIAQEEPRASKRSGARRWPWMVLSTGIAIGVGSIGARRGSCTPSRGVILEQPRADW